MKIYINNQLQKTEILPSNTPTLDETLETFSFVLISNDNPLPLAPMQEVKVDFNDEDANFVYFYIVSDSVDTYSLNPIKYKHTISCIQNTRELSKHVVRNSVFTQPANPIKNSYNALCGYTEYSSGSNIQWTNQTNGLNWSSEKLTLSNKEKIKHARFKISFQCALGNVQEPTQRSFYQHISSLSDIFSNTNAIQLLALNQTLELHYTNSVGTPMTPERITPSTFGVSDYNLNGEYEFPRITELANLGYNNFELKFTENDFITGQYRETEEIPSLPYTSIFLYMVQIQIVAETYYWSAYDILSLLVERQRLKNLLDNYEYKDPLFNLPSWTEGSDPQQDALYTLLKNTVAPNFTFTELTMYECVAEVFRLFDAIFTMDENKTLGIEYFNDMSGEVLQNPKFTGRNLSLSEDKYTNGLIAYYQDGRTKEIFPNKNSFANLRSEEFGVPEEQDHHFIVPHKIQSIIKCEIAIDRFGCPGGMILYADADYRSTGIVIDITRYVVEKMVWAVLNVGSMSTQDWNDRILKQVNTVYFEKGDNKIQVAYYSKNSWGVIDQWALYNAVKMELYRMAGETSSDQNADRYDPTHVLQGAWGDIKMRLTYTTTVDGVTKVHSVTKKYDGETLVDQANGAVDLNKMGLNMLGLSLKLGNPTLNATHKITKWSNRIKTGQIYNYQGKTWVANVVNYTFFNGYLQGKISFVQNFNQLALRTRLLREKRMTNISSELVNKSEIVMTDFIYYSSADISEQSEQIHFDETKLQDLIYRSFRNSSERDSLEYAIVYSANLSTRIYIPLIKYGAGNTINFEMSFDNPMSAGKRTQVIPTGWFSSSSFFTTSVNYTDDDGFLDVINIKSPTYKATFTNDFPLITSGSSADYNSDFFNIGNLEIYKQPNEIFALNYQLAFLPYEENIDFLGSAFINDNIFVNSSKFTNVDICFKEEKSSFLDTKATPYFLRKHIIGAASISKGVSFLFQSITSAEKERTKSWCLVDSDDNVLFASNRPLSATFAVIFHYITKKNRIN